MVRGSTVISGASDVLRLHAAGFGEGKADPQQSQRSHRALQHARRRARRMGRSSRALVRRRRGWQGQELLVDKYSLAKRIGDFFSRLRGRTQCVLAIEVT